MEKRPVSLNEAASKLKMVSEAALEHWSNSLDGVVSSELLDYFRQRVQFALERIDKGFITELSLSDSLAKDGKDAVRVLPPDSRQYSLIKSELQKAFNKQIRLTNLETCDKQKAENQISFLLRVVEDSVAVDLMSAVFDQAEKLKAEKHYVKKALCDIDQLIERDRERLAFDLHDGLAQTLSSALLQLDILGNFIESAQGREELTALKDMLSQGLKELRSSIYALKPQNVPEKALVSGLKDFVTRFSTKTGIEVEFNIDGQEREVSEAIKVNIFRIAQEALNNIHKHARATKVIFKIAFDESKLFCSIEDNGIGFNADDWNGHTGELNGYGLTSMRNRVEQLFGTFKVRSSAESGTSISFNIPLWAKVFTGLNSGRGVIYGTVKSRNS